MDLQDPSSSWKSRDFTLPLFLSGVFSTGACIILCVVVYLARDVINTTVIPGLGLARPTAGPPLCPGIPAGWQEKMNDDFTAANKYYWEHGVDNDEYADATTHIEDGSFQWDITANQGVYYSRKPLKNNAPENFYVSTEIRKLSGPADAEYGIIFRALGDQALLFSIQDSGLTKVHVRDAEANWQPTLFRGYSENVNANGSNQLVVFRQGDQYTFCVNQYVVGQASDSNYPSGGFGLAAELENDGDQVLLEFDNFTVFAPPP